jgi:hypothetical protein
LFLKESVFSREGTMFIQLMELMEKNSGRLAANLMGEIRKRDEARRPDGGAGGAGSARNMGAIYQDLLEWLFDNLQKGNLIAYYSSVGEQTHLEGERLEDIVTAILVIQKEITSIIIDEIDGPGGLPLKGILDMVFRVNLFFDLVMHSVISGYHKEPAQAAPDSSCEKAVMSTIFLG